jgi:hypothetical protein
MTRSLLASLLVAALVSAGCSNLLNDVTQSSSSNTPSATGVQAMTGVWSSVSSTTVLQNTCTNFQWVVTDIQDSTVSGSFTATCLQNMTVAGTSSGVLSGSTLTWTATAMGTSPTVSNCPISLSGTAEMETANEIRVPFTGTTCAGPVTGTEILRK